MSAMSNQNNPDNDVNGAGTFCEGPSPGRCSPVRQRRPGRYPTTVRTKWNKEVNKVVMEWNVFIEANHLTKMENLSEDTGKECSENGGTGEGLSQLSNVYVTRPEPSERTAGFQNLSWK